MTDQKMYKILVYSYTLIKWKHFLHCWPFVQGIHRSPVNSTHKGQWHGALMFPLSFARINGWINNFSDLRCHCAHYYITVMACIYYVKLTDCVYAFIQNEPSYKSQWVYPYWQMPQELWKLMGWNGSLLHFLMTLKMNEWPLAITLHSSMAYKWLLLDITKPGPTDDKYDRVR